MPLTPATRKALQRAAKQYDNWRQERNTLIGRAHAEGASLREIAAHTGITHVAVLKILRQLGDPASEE